MYPYVYVAGPNKNDLLVVSHVPTKREILTRREEEEGRGSGEVSRTLGLLEEPSDVAGAQLYRLPSSYRRDFVWKTYDVRISISLSNSRWISKPKPQKWFELSTHTRFERGLSSNPIPLMPPLTPPHPLPTPSAL